MKEAAEKKKKWQAASVSFLQTSKSNLMVTRNKDPDPGLTLSE